MPGPIPKRSEERIRRNVEEFPITKIPVNGEVKIPLLGIKDAHPIVRDLYRSLGDSAQSRYFEPSDWQYARTALHFLDGLIKDQSGKPSPMMLSTINQMLSSLLVAEGDRRRVRLEVERNRNLGGAQVYDLSVAQMFREQLTKQSAPATGD